MPARVAIVVGNPKPRSRTMDVAVAFADGVADRIGVPQEERVVIELAGVAQEVFDASSATIRSLVATVSTAEIVVVASPTYKATYTGLLKAFLDWFGPSSLAGAAVLPIMVGGNARHALAVEVHLRPLLVEIGGVIPTRGVFIEESSLENLDQLVQEWLSSDYPTMYRALA